MDRSWLTTFSMFCTYAGNTLLMKKGNHRFAVDLATYFKQGQQLSEHMFITGMTGPGGRKTYFAGAAPSGCGKTTTAMVGTDFVGDDLAQMWIAEDGTLRAVNPEKGIFGIVEDVNREGDPYLMKCLREEGTEVIWSNVLIDDDKVPHWAGNGEEHPEEGLQLPGRVVRGQDRRERQARPDLPPQRPRHPRQHRDRRTTTRRWPRTRRACRSRSSPTAAATATPCRRSGWPRTRTRASSSAPPSSPRPPPPRSAPPGVKRQPWANAPFIPGALADYMDAQFKFFNSDKLIDEASRSWRASTTS